MHKIATTELLWSKNWPGSIRYGQLSRLTVTVDIVGAVTVVVSDEVDVGECSE